MAISLFWLLILVLVFAFGSAKMVHHFILFAPLRFLFGFLFAIAAVGLFLIAIYRKSAMIEERAMVRANYPPQQAAYPIPEPPHPANINASVAQTSAKPIETIPAPQSVTEDASGGEKPDWIQHPDGHAELQGSANVYVVTVTAAYPCYTQGESDLALLPAVNRAVTDYAEREFPNLVNGTGRVNLETDLINNHLIRKRYYEVVHPKDYGQMFQEHALLVFDPTIRAAVERQSRGTVVAERLQEAAVGLGAVLLALGAIHSLTRQKSNSVQAA